MVLKKSCDMCHDDVVALSDGVSRANFEPMMTSSGNRPEPRSRRFSSSLQNETVTAAILLTTQPTEIEDDDCYNDNWVLATPIEP